MKPFPFILLLLLLTGCFKADISQSDSFISTFMVTAEHQPSKAVAWADSITGIHTMPFIEGEEVLFLFRGDVESVVWNGDFNRWGRDVTNEGSRISGSDWWFSTSTFPKDARLDYKIVINGTDWIEDSLNPHRQLGGGGFNSVIKMPEWQDLSVEADASQRGTTAAQRSMRSDVLEASVSYIIHKTPNFSENQPFGILVITDGHEYVHPETGNIFSQADYLDQENLIMPLVLIAVDPRDPETGENLRADHYVRKQDYLRFIGDELPNHYAALFEQSTRNAILGTSFGGFFATRLSGTNPERFPHAIIQSPAYWPEPEMLDVWRNTTRDDSRRIVLTYGTIHDGAEWSEVFWDILQEKTEQATQIVVNEGHSWGAWRNQIPKALMSVFGE